MEIDLSSEKKESGAVKCEIDELRKESGAVKCELDELRKMLGGQEVIRYFVTASRMQMGNSAEYKSVGKFIKNNSESHIRINGNYVSSPRKEKFSGQYFGTAGCDRLLKQGKYVFKVKIIQLEYFCVGFFPKREGKGKPSWGEWIGDYDDGRKNISGSYGYDGSNIHGCDSNTEFPKFGHKLQAGDVITAMLDLDQGTISYSHNWKYLGVAFTNVKGMYYAGVSLSGHYSPYLYCCSSIAMI